MPLSMKSNEKGIQENSITKLELLRQSLDLYSS